MIHPITKTLNQGSSTLCVACAAYHWARPRDPKCPPIKRFISLLRELDPTPANDRAPLRIAGEILCRLGYASSFDVGTERDIEKLQHDLTTTPLLVTLPYYSDFYWAVGKEQICELSVSSLATPRYRHAFHLFGFDGTYFYFQDSYGRGLPWTSYAGWFKLHRRFVEWFIDRGQMQTLKPIK